MQRHFQRVNTQSNGVRSPPCLGTLSPNPWHFPHFANSMGVGLGGSPDNPARDLAFVMLLVQSDKCQGPGDSVPGGCEY
jgi:hypothetical protein